MAQIKLTDQMVLVSVTKNNSGIKNKKLRDLVARRQIRFDELDAEFRQQSRRLSRLTSRIKHSPANK